MSVASNRPLVGSPAALFRLFAGGNALPSWRMFSMRLSRAQRLARRKEIFGSFTRTIAHTPHRLAVLRGQEGDRQTVHEKPARSFASAAKRENRRLARLRETSLAIPRSNRKPPKGPSAEKRAAIKRRETRRQRHEERTASQGDGQ